MIATLKRNLALVLAAVVTAVAVSLLFAAHQINNPDAPDNLAHVDKAATEEVVNSVGRALTQVLSYDYANPTIATQAADSHLQGDARKEYDVLLATLQEQAAEQKLTLSASVQAVGVKHLDEDDAELLIFLDQTSQRESDDERTVSAAQLAVKAQRIGGAWQIVNFTTL